ncbi:hypothetical protein KKQ11_00260 [Pseudomonas sp. MG-2]|uniref:hypothetical protein n=1 Tax=Pseudomonas sp. MG-2 TaxID=405714 RepID=UPI001C003E35|nr:hypothetical protein [Pseudomonas sp. MG-2]MBT9234254.1 hypothetical protein [Pseudomonas sp. MG-2]
MKHPYGSPEYEAECAINSNCYQAVNWGRTRMGQIVDMEDKKDRVSAWSDMTNYIANLASMIRNIADGDHVHFCACCGKPEMANYREPTKSRLIDRQLCFGCDFWIERRALYNAQSRKGHLLVIKGWTYGDSGNRPNCSGNGLGFGGQRFYICQLTTGRLWTTNNLFCGGEIPAEYLPGMPDNAVMLTKEQYELAEAGRQ